MPIIMGGCKASDLPINWISAADIYINVTFFTILRYDKKRIMI